ncbi:MAG: glycoside hydrolase family 95-like protein [Verrucomicrobiota bacterium]
MKKLTWHFPLPRTHTGVLLGNGTQGLMVWGTDRLCITVGRAGFWDHRNATPFTARITYQELRRLLETNNEAGLRAAFGSYDPVKTYVRPCQLGGGRLELKFGRGVVPSRADLDCATGTLVVTLSNGARVKIRQAMDAELAWVETSAAYTVKTIPAWDFIGQLLAREGVQPPVRWRTGFCQELPADEPLALAWNRHGKLLTIATALGSDARRRAQELTKTKPQSQTFWRQYWRDVPRVELPDPVLQHVWDYGVYKQAGLTTPGGVAATLQGPWMEEYQLPPWSNDYHFNINAQMIYWPALGTNRLAHFAPLWKMIRGWLPLLRENATKFFEVSDALMLPHAVDDQCGVVGSFWTGTIDHACTAWVAQMAWLHYRYAMDEQILREMAWPLLTGAFNGYWAMLEEFEGRLSLPVSVSPEYGAADMTAWGRDASFQLAALHFLAATLPKAAQLLGEPVDPRWARVTRELPAYTLIAGKRIGLWRGQDLAESHRHHSHLGGIFPFATIDPSNAAHQNVVLASLEHWQTTGAGSWTGWCVPWAAILCARCNLADAAVTWLHWWHDVFTNVGNGTLHDSDFTGAGGMHRESWTKLATEPNREIMQMDASLGAVTAILELLMQCRGEVIHVLPALPRRWRELKFDGIRTEGAFLIGATVAAGKVVEVRVTSLAGARLRLVCHGKSMNRATKPGQRLTLSLS